MVDVATIKARAAARLAATPPAANVASLANRLTPPAPISQLATLASNDEATPDPDRYCWPHSDGMNTAELARMEKRLALFMLRGITEPEADRMADRLMFLERDGSPLRACLVCERLTGAADQGWRCTADRLPQVAKLHRCDSYRSAAG